MRGISSDGSGTSMRVASCQMPTAAITTTNPPTATHRQVRRLAVRRPRVPTAPVCVAMDRRSKAKSRADWNRSSGFFSRQRVMIR
jgi:hypothetical protein